MAEPAREQPRQRGAALYDRKSIKVLKGLDAVRKRPGMYIGDTDDGSGLHHMVYEVVDNAIDEALAGYCRRGPGHPQFGRFLHGRDNGRGIPTDIHRGEGVSAAEVIMTQLHAGGKFDQNSYKVSGGLHGVGVSVVNALSAGLSSPSGAMATNTYEFQDGVPVAPLTVVGSTPQRRGTEVTFLPRRRRSARPSSTLRPRAPPARARLPQFRRHDRAYRPAQRRSGKRSRYEGGVKAFVTYLDRTKTPLDPRTDFIKAERDGLTVEWPCSGTTGIRNGAVLHQQHPAARRRYPPRRLPRRADPRTSTGYTEASGSPNVKK